MKNQKTTFFASFILVCSLFASAQNTPDTIQQKKKKFQAVAPMTIPFGKEAFGAAKNTTVRWLGMAGFLVNSRGTTFMIDPLLEGYDMPLLMKFPILPKDVPHLDAVMATHSDNDHYSVETFKDLSAVTKAYHSSIYVDSLMKNEGLKSFGHKIGETFPVGKVKVQLTIADHAWQNAYPRPGQRHFDPEDACGFYFTTPDGTIWAPGDSKLMPEQLNLPAPNLILLDYSEDAVWHFGLEGSAKLLNAYPNASVLLGHWGFVDAPDFLPFNGDPERLKKLVVNPERIKVLAPGAPFELKKVAKQKL
jgi:L-ascorbate metabolism protein UlaG (beta-lactamase superfamily)